ncbi:AI-2E family transporter [Candidatus Parcubacteria bacterium]|nr:AI-2E family transporter [Patescibacteria group bacterium]MCG2687145.1 AI-2E family transporter [Candidatus Parcubacteria bacterium]
MSTQNLSISYTSIFRVIIVLLALYFIYLTREVFVILFLSVILAASFGPWVNWLQKHKIPRTLSILTIYIVLLAILALIIIVMVPPIAEQIGQLAKSLPVFYERLALEFSPSGVDINQQNVLYETLQTMSSNLGQTTKSVFSTLTGIFGGLVSFFAILVIVFYITVEEDIVKRFFFIFTPLHKKEYVSDLIDEIKKKMGMWLRGQLALSLIVGILTYIGLTVLGVKYALVLALIAGLFEIVPFVGPWLSAVPAVLIGFSDSLTKVILILALYFVIQQVENHLIVPKIMQKAVGLNPIIVIISILIGAKLFGVMGALIAVPIAAVIDVYLGQVFPHYAKSK